MKFKSIKTLKVMEQNLFISKIKIVCHNDMVTFLSNLTKQQRYILYMIIMGNGQKPSQTKALLSKNDKAAKSPPVKMTGQTKAFP
jgi:hypothetical protein